MGEEPAVPVKPPVLEATVYEVIADPPFEAGAVKVIVACPLPAVATPMVGAPGTVTGTTTLLVIEAELVPAAFVAVTVKL